MCKCENSFTKVDEIHFYKNLHLCILNSSERITAKLCANAVSHDNLSLVLSKTNQMRHTQRDFLRIVAAAFKSSLEK